MTISVVLPAYQEAENLKNILPNIHAVLKDVDHEILVIDTMTPMDDTETVCRENNTRYVPRTGGNLYGDAIRTGFAGATGKYTVIMDADGSHDPREILNFLAVMEQGQTDLVIGSRYCKGGYTDNNFILRFMSWALNVTYRVFFGLKVKDVSDSFRMYKTQQIQQLQFECDNFDIVEEILIKLSYSFDPYIIRELPISFNKRVSGESKRDLVKFIISYITTIRKLLRIKHSTVKGR